MNSHLATRIGIGSANSNWVTIYKFGRSSLLSTGGGAVPETIWTEGGAYPWSVFDQGAIALKVVSNTVDTGSITIEGLDNNFHSQTESIVLGSATSIDLTKTFRRVFRVFYNSPSNTHDISIQTDDENNIVVAQILANRGQSEMAVYTVPSNVHNAYMCCYTAGTGKDQEAEIDMFVREHGDSAFRIKSSVELRGSCFTQKFYAPMKIPPGSDIDFRGLSSTANCSATLNFELWVNKQRGT